MRVPYRNRLYGFMSICYNFWVLIFRCLSVVLHSVSDCNPWAADARSVLSRWGGCPGALSGRVPKLFGPFCGPTEGCRAFCGGAHAGADDPEGRGPIARLCLPCARMGAMTKKRVERSFDGVFSTQDGDFGFLAGKRCLCRARAHMRKLFKYPMMRLCR